MSKLQCERDWRLRRSVFREIVRQVRYVGEMAIHACEIELEDFQFVDSKYGIRTVQDIGSCFGTDTGTTSPGVSVVETS